jgi:hypothetical protein
MNLLEVYIDSLPIETSMKFGINSKVKLNHLDISDRLTRKGEVSPKNFFMEFLKVDDDGIAIEREEFSFFKFNAEKLDFAERNFNDQFNKLLNLGLVLYNNDENALEAKAKEISDKMFGKDKDITDLADDIFIFNSKTMAKKKPKLRKLKVMVEELNTKLNEFFYALFEGKYGLDNSPEMELISIVDKKGYKNLPDEAEFVSLIPGKLSLEMKYVRRKEASEKPEVEDEVGDEISQEGIGDLEDLVDDIGVEGDLDSLGDLENLSDLEDLT